MLQGVVRLLPSSQDMEAAICTKAAGGRMASSVRGSSAKRKPYRISKIDLEETDDGRFD